MNNVSIDIGAKWLGGNNFLQKAIRRAQAFDGNDYQKFVDVLYEDLDAILHGFQANPQSYQSNSEDVTTHIVVMNLNQIGYNASHNKQSGGNVDLTVQSSANLGAHSWIGEAKIYKSIADPREGFLQLSSRYKPASGNYNHNCQGLLLYIYRPNCLGLMSDWRSELSTKLHQNCGQSDDDFKNPFAFNSEYIHDSGLKLYVRHVGVNLHFHPTDKSARSRKSKAKL